MLFNRLWPSLRPLAAPSALTSPLHTRMFSASAIADAGYKMKTHHGAKKRWRSLASGNSFKRAHAGHHHKNVAKPSDRKNRLQQTAYSTSAQTHKLKKWLLPYGSH